MRLFYSSASPFARKVLIAAHELGVADKIEIVSAPTTPVARNAEVAAVNPLGKVPALSLDDGTAIYDSRVIVEHLDLVYGGGRLIPTEAGARVRALTGQALADGVLDAALLVRYEAAVRPEALRWADWRAGQFVKIEAGLDAAEAALNDRFEIDSIAFVSMLGYLDFRFADHPWRPTRPRLAAWFAQMSERPSVSATVPTA